MTSACLPALLTSVLVFVAGAGWFALLLRRHTGGTEWFAVSFALGAAWLGLSSVVLSGLGAQATLLGFCVALALPVGLALLRLRHGSQPGSDRLPIRTALGEWLGFGPAMCIAGLSFWFACQRPVWNIDAQKRWVLHGQWMSAYHTAVPDVVRDEAWSTTYPTYPPLVSAQVSEALDLGADPDMGIRPLFPVFFLALLAGIHGYGCRIAGRRRAHFIALAFALTPCFGYLDRWKDALGLAADAAMADIPLATLLTVGSILVLRILEKGGSERGVTFTAGLVLAGVTLTKQEGSVSAIAVLILAAVWTWRFCTRSQRCATLRSLASCAAAVVVVAGAWKALSSGLPVELGNDYVNAGAASSLFSRMERLPVILHRVGSEFVQWKTWGPLWILPIFCSSCAVLQYYRDRNARSLLPILTCAWIVAGTALAMGSYLVTGWKGGNFTFLMEVSLTRLLMHHAPLVAIMVCQSAHRDTAPSSE